HQEASWRQTRDQQNQLDVGRRAWSYLISNWGCSGHWADWSHPSSSVHWADERGADRLGHPVEADDALAGTAGGERLDVALEQRLDVLPVVAHPDVAGRIDVDVNLHLQTAAHVTAGRGNRIAHLLAGRPGVGVCAAKLHDANFVAGKVVHPDVVVAVDGYGPRACQTVATDGRARVLASIATQYRDASAFQISRLLLGHGGGEDGIGLAVFVHRPQHARQARGTAQRVAQTVGHPDVALAVHRHPADAVADLELLDLCWVVGGETADPVGAGVSDPDAILLVNHHGKGSQQMPGILQGIFRLIDKEELHLLGIALGEIHDLGVVDVGCPDVAVGRDDDLLHFAELATKGPTLGWGKRFAGLVELDDRLAAVGGAQTLSCASIA